MARNLTTAKLHFLTAREVLAALDGDTIDGGGLLLRVRDSSVSWVYRFTAVTGKRREMGLGVAHRGSLKHAGESLSAARDMAHAARDLVKRGDDPIDHREARRRRAQEAVPRVNCVFQAIVDGVSG